MTSAEFKRDYDITFEVSKIRVNNKNVSEDDLLIPEVMGKYLKYSALYEDDVIKYFFNSDYVSYWDYIKKAIDNELRIKDEKCYSFLEAVYAIEED